MIFRIMADLLVIVHLMFIIFVLFGGLLLIWRGSLIFIHLPAAIWAALISFKGGICPLTPLENHLRGVAGSAGYEQGFVEHYLIPIVYPGNLTPNIQFLLGMLVVLINLGIYGWVYYKHMAKRRRKQR